MLARILLIFIVSAATAEAFFRLDSIAQALGWIDTREARGELKVSLSPVEVINSYRRVARELLKKGYYSGLLSAIHDSESVQGSCIVMDCPSGSGKTLAGIA